MTAPRTRRAKISKRTVDAEPTPDGGESRVWDTELKGFCLRVYAASGKAPQGRRVYGVKYRLGRTQRWFRIGEHGSPWTPDQAREKAAAVLRDAQDGKDPQAAKAELRSALTVGELIDVYLEKGPAAKPAKRASSWAQDRSSLERHARPLLGKRVARDIRSADLTQLALDIRAGKTAADIKTKKRGRAIIRGGAGVAKRTISTVSAMFGWAMKDGGLALPKNPAAGVSGELGGTAEKEAFLTAEQSRGLFQVLDEMEAAKEISAAQADVFRLLLLTGSRKSEIAGLQWSEVDLARRRLVLPPARTKAGGKTGVRRIALSPAAAAILEKRRGSNESFVFPAHRGDGHIVGLNKPWARIRERVKLPGVRIHDLRHSFASFAIADGASLFLVSKALGHADTRVTERYAHLQGDALDQLAEGAGRWLTPGSQGGGQDAE